MSIDRINRQVYINAYSSNSNKSVEKSKKSSEVDRIEISALGKSLTDYSKDETIGNAKKVEEIKTKIENGTYNVDAKLTAKSILDAIKENKA